MRGHDVYFPNCREIYIMSPYSSRPPLPFRNAAGGGIMGQTHDLRVAKRFFAVSGGLVFCAPQNT